MKILLIEYEPRYLERIHGYLGGKDFELVVARDGDEGLAQYRRSRPDLVLISSVLPRLRTPDVIRGMQASGATPPILLMMSGYKGRNKRADAQRIGAWSILEKPFGEEIFMAEVQAALGLRPELDLPPAGGAQESGEPLLSADDIFSDILSGIDESTPAPVPPPAIDPAMEKRLETTLSGLIPPRKGESSPGFVPPRTDVPRGSGEMRVPGTAETMKVNIGDLAPGSRAPERAKTGSGTSASVDKLLQETLSGLKIRSKPGTGSGLTDPGLTAPARPVSSAPGPASSAPSAPMSEPRRERVVPPPIAPVPAAPPAAAPRLAPAAAPHPATTLATPALPTSTPARAPSRLTRPPSGPGAFGRYQLLERIASGGMADVFKARMTGEEGFEKIVAIKRILPHLATNEGFITMFVDEAKLAAQLSHNNIIHIYELGKVDAWHYIAMEYVDGKDLRSILKMGRDRSYPLPVELSLFIASRIANALDYAHRRVAPDGTELNLVHRDVSPQNILISWEGDIKLCDFGVAKAATKVSTTMSGALKGKLQFMSPEQAWGKKIDRRSDIFSLGAVLFEMLTGLPLFEGENDMTILEKVRDGQVEPPSARNAEVPRKVDQIVLKALAKNAQDRYQNASEFEKDLLSVLYGYQPSPGPADLAIYVHRLLETPPSTSDDDIDAAFAAAQQPLEVTPSPKRGKGLVLAKGSEREKSGEPKPAAIAVPSIAPVAETRPMAVPARHEPFRPVAVVEPHVALPEGGDSKKSRAGLFAGIGVAAAALVAAGLFFARGRGSAPAPAVAPPPPSTATEPSTISPASAAEAMKVVDPKAVEAEAKRLAAETERARKEAEKKAAAGKTGTPVAVVPGLSLAAKAPAEPPKAAEGSAPAPAPSAAVPAPAAAVAAAAPGPTAPAPTVVAVAVPPAVPAPEAARPAPTEVSVPQAPPAVPAPAAGKPNVGDLVGPGEDVVEPKLIRLGPFTGLPQQARQLTHSSDGTLGITVLMGLVDENGNVTDVRLIRPSPHKFVDDAAIRSLRSAKITPATKDGVKVKMWSTFAITVKP
jgi:TonB family protein